MVKKGIYTIIILIVLGISSCQPTPEKSIVKNKDDGNLMEIIRGNNGEVINDYQFPKEWIDEYKTDDLSVSIRAQIKTPDVGKYPIIQVKPINISNVQAKKIIEVLTGDEQLYLLEQFSLEAMTKSEIEAEVIEVKRRISPAYWKERGCLEGEIEEHIEREKEHLEMLEKRYPNAPKKNDLIPVDLESEESLRDGLFAGGQTKNKRNLLCSYSSQEDEARYSTLTWSLSLPMEGDEFIERTEIITEENAIKKANDFVIKVGLDDFTVNRLSIEDHNRITEDSTTQYNIYLTRTYEGIPVTYTVEEQGMGAGKGSNIYTMPWLYESIRLAVSKSGIDFFQWKGPSGTEEKISENVKLLPFDEILDIFRQQIKNHASWIDDVEGIVSRRLFIDEIRLGYMRVNMKDRIDEYMMIPVWDFFGYTVDKYAKQQEGGWLLDENNEYLNREDGKSFLTINAVDGSMINRELGY